MVAYVTGPFEKNGMKPSVLDIGRVTRTECARRVVNYLSENWLPAERLTWDAMSEQSRETLVTALSNIYSDGTREITKAAMDELKRYEALAVARYCRRCGAAEQEACRDLRRSVIAHIKHPHAERMNDIEGAAA